ncbi:pro-resilin-like [Penaeus japonicus]|uniref:pro-resilin-like n=1 Tax=Penaeus japonicus TaxID=27405 RepID=UPI001C70FF1E|nr:pro-resilin-like [Penaeus japonicus]
MTPALDITVASSLDMGLMIEVVLLMLLSHAYSESWTLPSYRIHGSTHGVGYTQNVPDAQYQFFYQVRNDKTGIDFGHQESRKGRYTQGSYHVRLPDGRLQRVAYTVNGESGFRARVFYEDAAKDPRPDSFAS